MKYIYCFVRHILSKKMHRNHHEQHYVHLIPTQCQLKSTINSKWNQYEHYIDNQLVFEMSNLTWCKLAGNTMSWVCWGWAGGVVAGAGVGGLLLPPAAVVNRAVVAMAVSPRLLMLLSITANRTRDVIIFCSSYVFWKD